MKSIRKTLLGGLVVAALISISVPDTAIADPPGNRGWDRGAHGHAGPGYGRSAKHRWKGWGKRGGHGREARYAYGYDDKWGRGRRHHRSAEVEVTGPVGPGAVIGGIVGGLIGNQVGPKKGRTAATVGGAVFGAIIGNELFKAGKSRSGGDSDTSRDHGGSTSDVTYGANCHTETEWVFVDGYEQKVEEVVCDEPDDDLADYGR